MGGLVLCILYYPFFFLMNLIWVSVVNEYETAVQLRKGLSGTNFAP